MPLFPGAHWGHGKPPRGAQVDWGHPLAANLVCCYLFNEGNPPYNDLCHNTDPLRDVTTASNLVQVPTLYGGGGKVLANDLITPLTTLTLPFLPSANAGFSTFTIYTPTTVVGITGLLCVSDATTDRFNLLITSTIKWGFQTATGAAVTLISPSTPVAGVTYAVGCVWDRTIVLANNKSFYLNGALDSVDADADQTVRALATPGLGLQQGGANGLGTVSAYYAWQRPLGAGEMAWLAAEPYACILQPPLRRFAPHYQPAAIPVVHQAVQRAAGR